MTDLRWLYVTTKDSSEAKKLAKVLLENKLIACANILPEMTSLYEWNGEIEESLESVLVLKTKQEFVEKWTLIYPLTSFFKSFPKEGPFWLKVVCTSSHYQIACHVRYSIIWL